MIIVLQVAGALAALIGVVTIGIGIPVKEFSFGNTLIVAGTAGLCTGLILLGLSVVAMELRAVARRLAAGAAARPTAEPRARPTLPAFLAPGPAASAPGEAGPAFSPPPIVPQAEPPGAPAPSAPRHEDIFGHGRPPDAPAGAAESAQTPSGPAQKPRRNLLFQSTVRKDRERPPRPVDPASVDFRAQPPAAPPVTETGETSPVNFEDAWPRPDRPRTAERPVDRAAEVPPRRAGRLSSASAPTEPNAAAAERAPGRTEEPPPGVTVLKSGVVDGMAYSLYSDGSIEAQMPEGMMRFASIDDLRAHLDQRS